MRTSSPLTVPARTSTSRRRGRILATLALTLISTSLVLIAGSVPAQASGPTSCDSLRILAHRGYHAGPIAENTIAAYDGAAARGYTIETDVRQDAQGQLWIFHDRNALRATGVNANIDQMTTDQVAALRYKKGNYPLPTIEQAIADWQSHPSTPVYAEPKSQQIAQAFATKIVAAGLSSQVVYTAQQQYLSSTFPGSLLMERFAGATAPSPQQYVNERVQVVSFGPDALSPSAVDAYHAAGLRLQLRTSSSTNDWRKAIRLGFDEILTDQPDALKAFCGSALLPPQVSSFSPGSGSPGTVVTITGSNFTDASRVAFGSVAATYTVVSSSQITATVPTGVSGDVPVSVTTPNGQATSTQTFQIPLRIDSFSPAAAPRGSTVTITGVGFTGADRVRFGTVDATTFTVDSDSQISVVVPDLAPASSRLSVRTPSGSVTSADAFKVPPTVTSFSPTSGTPGTTVTITGSAFTGTTSVKFGTVSAASFSVDSDTQISAVVPTGAPVSSNLRVVTPGGTVTSVDTFQNTAASTPTVASFSPTSGPVGTSVVITGTGFTGATLVKFGSLSTQYTVDSDTQVTATAPAGETVRSTKVTVVTPSGTATSPGVFTFTP